MPRLRIVSLKPFRGQHLVEAELQYMTGFWLWKKMHSRDLRLLTQDGVQWHYAPGEAQRGRLAPELEDALHRALEMYQAGATPEEP